MENNVKISFELVLTPEQEMVLRHHDSMYAFRLKAYLQERTHEALGFAYEKLRQQSKEDDHFIREITKLADSIGNNHE